MCPMALTFGSFGHKLNKTALVWGWLNGNLFESGK